ncbi:MAG: 3-hydroxybutyrate dehydrogenase [Betaproteobacteria bacterium]|nr:3-hydroxybutyrate dehydrogenase [Betaproteobacteria bacterium]
MALLRGRNALITGSNGGIGYAIAAALADQGCNIALNGPGAPDEIERLRSAIASRNVRCIYSPADVGKSLEIERMIADATAQLGSIDILVNNAVIRHFHPIEEFPVEEWDAALAVNVSAAFHTIRLVLAGMKARNWGRIINMGSIYSTRGCENRVDYVTAKHAILGITRTAALEVARTGITCNALRPGWVLTPHSERQIADEMAKSGSTREQAIQSLLETRQPSGRFVTKEQVAAFVVFLCSEAAANITGSALSIDGGWSAVP